MKCNPQWDWIYELLIYKSILHFLGFFFIRCLLKCPKDSGIYFSFYFNMATLFLQKKRTLCRSLTCFFPLCYLSDWNPNAHGWRWRALTIPLLLIRFLFFSFLFCIVNLQEAQHCWLQHGLRIFVSLKFSYMHGSTSSCC